MRLPQPFHGLSHAFLAHAHHFYAPFIIYILDFPTRRAYMGIGSRCRTELARTGADKGAVRVQRFGGLGVVIYACAGLDVVNSERRG